MIEILHMGQHDRALCLGLGKTNFSTTFCSELDLGVIMKVVGMDVILK
jgi:hypothetical protein